MAPVNGNGDSGSLKEQIRGLAEDRKRHEKNFDELFAKFDNIGRTNWQIILSALGVFVLVLGGLWALSANPITDDIKRLDRDGRRDAAIIGAQQAALAAQAVKIETLENTMRAQRENITRLEDSRLPAREFTIHQAANTNDRNAMQRQVDDLNKKIDAVFPPAKVLEDLVRRLSELERTRATLATSSAGKP